MELNTPTVVGFGISNAETYQAATKESRGAIIGSAFIKFLKETMNFLGILKIVH